MNKLFVGTAAAALMIAPATANPMAVTVGGYFNTALILQDLDAAQSASDMNQEQDAEIHFKGKSKLDNGLTVGFQVQLEGEENSDQIDEHYIYVSGDFGRVTIGAENSAADMLLVGMDKYLGYKQASDTLLNDLKVTGYKKTNHTAVTGDANKFTYVSPRISGLQAGISFTPSTKNLKGDARGVESSGAGIGDDAISLGLRYKTSLGGTKIALSYGSEKAEEGGAGTQGDGTFKDSSIGLQARAGKVQLSYISLTREADAWNEGDDVENYEKDQTNLTLSYKLSKNASIGFDMQDDEVTSGDGAGDTYEHIRFGGSYKIAKGMQLTLSHLSGEKKSGGASQDSTVTTAGLLLKF